MNALIAPLIAEAKSQAFSSPTPAAKADPKLDALIATLFGAAAAQASPTPTPTPDAKVNEFMALLFGAANSKASPAPNARRVGSANAMPSHSRSEDSLAVERYLRSRLVGGLTDKQVVELSDAIGERFDGADIAPEQRAWCLGGEGEKRQLYLCNIYQVAKGELTPVGTKAAAEELVNAIAQMIPPRAVFNSLFEYPPSRTIDAKPLAALEGPVLQGRRNSGALATEHLESFKRAIYNLSGWDRKNKESPAAYWGMVEKLPVGDVLFCDYRTESSDLISRPFYFWYQNTPDGLDDLLKTLPPDHPIRQIGPARDNAPGSFELAMQGNQESATLVKKDEEDLKKWRAAEAQRKKNAGGGFLEWLEKCAKVGIVIGLHEREQERQHYERVQQIVASSGGTKIECPKRGGSGKVFYSGYNSGPNPYPWHSLEHQTFEDQRESIHMSKCDTCGGTGVIDR